MSNKGKFKKHVVIAGDVTAGTIDFHFGDSVTQMIGAIVQVETSAGVVKAWDGAKAISGPKLTIDNTGATDWAATDVISVAVF